ncbi:MAG: type II secretion system protein [Thermoguttaceae bacterium]
MELLTVITIIGMLAGLSLGALYSARESARVAKTRATIAKLDMIVQARYDEFLSRRVPIKTPRIPPKAMAELRLQILRELIRMEMPDRLTDITYPRTATPLVRRTSTRPSQCLSTSSIR